MTSEADARTRNSPEYQRYHARVVGACVELMGEQIRWFFDKECTYFEELAEGLTPEECAWAQYEALL